MNTQQGHQHPLSKMISEINSIFSEVGFVFAEPRQEILPGDIVRTQRGDLGDVGEVFLDRKESALPAVLKALIDRNLHEQAGPPVAAGVELAQ